MNFLNLLDTWRIALLTLADNLMSLVYLGIFLFVIAFAIYTVCVGYYKHNHQQDDLDREKRWRDYHRNHYR